jgi:hypothetical protein
MTGTRSGDFQQSREEDELSEYVAGRCRARLSGDAFRKTGAV